MYQTTSKNRTNLEVTALLRAIPDPLMPDSNTILGLVADSEIKLIKRMSGFAIIIDVQVKINGRWEHMIHNIPVEEQHLVEAWLLAEDVARSNEFDRSCAADEFKRKVFVKVLREAKAC